MVHINAVRIVHPVPHITMNVFVLTPTIDTKFVPTVSNECCVTYGNFETLESRTRDLCLPSVVTLNAPSVTGRCPATPVVCLPSSLLPCCGTECEAVGMVAAASPFFECGFPW